MVPPHIMGMERMVQKWTKNSCGMDVLEVRNAHKHTWSTKWCISRKALIKLIKLQKIRSEIYCWSFVLSACNLLLYLYFIIFADMSCGSWVVRFRCGIVRILIIEHLFCREILPILDPKFVLQRGMLGFMDLVFPVLSCDPGDPGSWTSIFIGSWVSFILTKRFCREIP